MAVVRQPYGESTPPPPDALGRSKKGKLATCGVAHAHFTRQSAGLDDARHGRTLELELEGRGPRSEMSCAKFGARQIKKSFYFHSYVDPVHLGKKKYDTGKKSSRSI